MGNVFDAQHKRRGAPMKWTWEPFAAALLICVLVLFVATHLARSVANALVLQYSFTPQRALFTCLDDLLALDAGCGMETTGGQTLRVAPTWLFGIVLALTHLATIILLCYVAALWWRHCGPNRLKGMASEREVLEKLGVARLDREKHMIRPDIYRPPNNHPKSPANRTGPA
jgi:hypothetical protein